MATLLLLKTIWLNFSIDCCDMLQLYVYASLYISVLFTLPVLYSAYKIMSKPASWKCIDSTIITINITMVILFKISRSKFSVICLFYVQTINRIHHRIILHQQQEMKLQNCYFKFIVSWKYGLDSCAQTSMTILVNKIISENRNKTH